MDTNEPECQAHAEQRDDGWAGARGWWRGGDRSRYRGLAEVHVSLRNPQVELVPCRRYQIVSALVDTSKTMEGGTST